MTNNTTSPATAPRIWRRLVAAVHMAETAVAVISWYEFPADYATAKADLAAARTALRIAFETAAWGANGSAFVTKRSHWPGGDGCTRTLYLQGRRVASCNDGWIEIFDLADAEQEYGDKRIMARNQDIAYKIERRLLIAALEDADQRCPADFGEWMYSPGQKGGCFYRSGSGQWIAADSALRAAIYFGGNCAPEVELAMERRYYGARHL